MSMSGILFAEQVILRQISEIVPDVERKSTAEITKFLMNSNHCFINELVIKLLRSRTSNATPKFRLCWVLCELLGVLCN